MTYVIVDSHTDSYISTGIASVIRNKYQYGSYIKYNHSHSYYRKNLLICKDDIEIVVSKTAKITHVTLDNAVWWLI